MQKDGDTPAERLRRQQNALAEFGLLAFQSNELDEILNCAAELVSEGMDVKHTKVLELLPGGNELLVRAGVGWNPGVVGKVTFGADHDSPGGYALSHDEPVVSPDVEAETRFEIPQMLRDHGIQSMVNVIIAGQQGPFGVLEVDASEHRDFDDDDIAFLRIYANLLAAAVERHQSHAGLENAAREKDVLIQELAHRAKNLLAIVDALARQTPAEGPGAKSYRSSFLDRLGALARSENILFEEQGKSIDLNRLVTRSLEPFIGIERGKIGIDGPHRPVPARSGRMLGLVLHELGTNSTKHGALSAPGGEVRISWAVHESADGRQIEIRWVESGGPAVKAPKREGFGTQLLTDLISYEVQGDAELDYAADGFRYRLVFPLEVE